MGSTSSVAATRWSLAASVCPDHNSKKPRANSAGPRFGASVGWRRGAVRASYDPRREPRPPRSGATSRPDGGRCRCRPRRRGRRRTTRAPPAARRERLRRSAWRLRWGVDGQKRDAKRSLSWRISTLVSPCGPASRSTDAGHRSSARRAVDAQECPLDELGEDPNDSAGAHIVVGDRSSSTARSTGPPISNTAERPPTRRRQAGQACSRPRCRSARPPTPCRRGARC